MADVIILVITLINKGVNVVMDEEVGYIIMFEMSLRRNESFQVYLV